MMSSVISAQNKTTASGPSCFTDPSVTAPVLHLDNFVNLYANSVDYASPSSQSVLLFNSWSNKAQLSVGNKIVNLENINFDVSKGTFVTKNGKDVVSFNLNGDIKKITINGRTFIKKYSDSNKANGVFEIIYEGPFNTILKQHKIRTSSVRVYSNTTEQKITKTSNYFIADGKSKLKSFKMNKKNLFKLYFNDKISTDLIKSYVKSNKLSLKKDSDIRNILNYSVQLKNSRLAKSN